MPPKTKSNKKGPPPDKKSPQKSKKSESGKESSKGKGAGKSGKVSSAGKAKNGNGSSSKKTEPKKSSKKAKSKEKGSSGEAKGPSIIQKLLSCFKPKSSREPESKEQASEKELLEQALGDVGDPEEEELVIEPADVVDFTKTWKEEFIPRVLSEYSFDFVYNKAAIEIQRIVRGFLGRQSHKRLWNEAVLGFVDFWYSKHEEKINDLEKKRREKLEAQQVSLKICLYFFYFNISLCSLLLKL